MYIFVKKCNYVVIFYTFPIWTLGIRQRWRMKIHVKSTDQDKSKNMFICLRVILTNTWSTFFLPILFFSIYVFFFIFKCSWERAAISDMICKQEIISIFAFSIKHSALLLLCRRLCNACTPAMMAKTSRYFLLINTAHGAAGTRCQN